MVEEITTILRKLSALFVGLLVMVAAAAEQNAPSDIDTSVDYSKFKTYQWDRPPDSEHAKYPADTPIVEEIERQFAKKGLKKTESNAPELLVCYHSNFGTEQIKRYTMTEGEATYSGTIKTGQVAIDMIDPTTDKLVWRNAADINPKARPQDVTKAVSKLLASYPPKRK